MTAFFATAAPGIGGILAGELTEAGVVVSGKPMFDGRSDIVAFEAKGTTDLDGIRTAEDLFVQIAGARQHTDPARVAAALCSATGIERALSVAAGQGVHVPANATVHVVARVRSERAFPRTAFREAVAAALLRARPRWRRADPGAVEIWAVETEPGHFRAGVRLTGGERRQHGGRAAEREGALRPTVAAAMVRLAGSPSPTGLPLLDPCCGSGTVLREAVAAGWSVAGADLDPEGLADAGRNERLAALVRADVHRLPLVDGSIAAVVSNLPFGHRFTVAGPAGWYERTLDEMTRVVAPGGLVVVLVPAAARLRAGGLVTTKKVAVRLLGRATTLWQLRRQA